MKAAALRRGVPVLALPVFVILLILFSRLSSAQPDEISSQQLLQSNYTQGRLMQSLYHAEVLASDSGWTSELAQTVGDIWAQMDDLPLAVSYWEVGAGVDPADATLLRKLAGGYLELRRWPEAGDTLRLLLTYAPDDNWAHYHLGLLEAAYNPSSALEHLQNAARDKTYLETANGLSAVLYNAPVDASVAMSAGLLLAERNLWPYAELAFEQAATLGSPFPEALAYAALAQDRGGKDGNDAITQALALAPDNPQVLFLYGLHLRAQFDNPGSLEAFQRANALDPQNPAYAAELGTAYRLIDDLGQAESWLKMAVTLSNNDPRFQSLLDTFYANLNLN